MKRTENAPNVHMRTAPADKFNRCRISLHFLFPAKRETATANAVLPLMLERGNADCPDMTALTKKLARLYGADLTVDARGQGANRNLCISVTGIKDVFALEGEDLTAEYTKLALGVAFRPYFVDGVFDAEGVEIEKTMLEKALQDEIKEKPIYCSRQASREFYKGTPEGVPQEGVLSEVPTLSQQAITDAYYEMIQTASIELIVLGYGEKTELVKDQLLAQLAKIKRAPAKLNPASFQPVCETKHFTATFDLTQAKLCMAFTTGKVVNMEEVAQYRVAMALFGGGVSSRLFLNVREKMNICYYCASGFYSTTGAMFVNSGVEPANAEKAEKAIMKELADLCDGPITDEEFEDCRRALVAGTSGVEDSLGGIEAWYYNEILRGGAIKTPAMARAELEAVTIAEVREILKQFSLSVSYLVTKKEG